MTTDMYDSTSVRNILAVNPNPPVVGCYPMGEYAWKRSDYALVPESVKNLIAIEFDAAELWKKCNTADVERFALTPADARRFIEYRHSTGKPGNTVYCSLVNVPAVQEACRGLAYWLWIADWVPGTPVDIDNAAAVQYQGNRPPGYDRSVVFKGEWVRELAEANRPWPLAA